MAYSCVVRVTKFDQMNPKAAGKKVLWFRLDSTMVHRGEYQSLSLAARSLWVHIMSMACTSTDRVVYLEGRSCAPLLYTRSTSRVSACVREVADLGWIQILTESDVPQQKPCTKERKKSTNVRTACVPPDPVQGALVIPDQAPPQAAPGRLAVVLYCDAYKKRYGHHPKIAPKQAGILGRLHKAYGATDYVRIIEGYFAMPSAFLIERSHPVELIDAKLNEITRYLETGKVVARAQAREFDEQVADEMTPRKGIDQIVAEHEQRKKLGGGSGQSGNV